MSAGILERDTQTGTSMGWHGKTLVVPEVTKDNSRICYPMEKRQLPSPFGGEIDFWGIFSMDDQRMVGNPVKQGYKLFDNARMYDMVENSLAGTSHKIVSIGSIGNREKLFASIKLADPIIAGGRETETVLNVLWGHGGIFGVLARSGMTVVVCANTFAMAMARKGEFELRLKHTGNSEAKLENMSKAIDAHYGVVSEFKAAMDSLTAVPCNGERAKEIFAGFLVRDNEVEEVSTRTSNTIDNLSRLFSGGAGNDGNDNSDVFNAFTDYYSHESSGGENRYKQFESSEFGAGLRAKTEAFKLLMGEDVPKLGDLETVIKRGSKVLQLV